MKKFHKNINIVLTLIIAIVSSTNTFAHKPSSVTASKTTNTSIELDVYKSPTCGCCIKWITHLEDNGILVKAHDVNNLSQIKDENSVPVDYRSCHTAISQDGYIFEGHIPAKFIKKFLLEKPTDLIGLVVPEMPVGSPGMEQGDEFTPYIVLAIKKDGTVSNYAKVNTQKQQFE